MLYDLQIEKESDFLSVKISGIRNSNTISKAAKEIIETCKINKCLKVIIDVRELEGRMSILESYMFVSREFTHLKQFSSLEKAAVVDNKESKKRLKFFERTANSFGFNLRTFVEPDEAREWMTT